MVSLYHLCDRRAIRAQAALNRRALSVLSLLNGLDSEQKIDEALHPSHLLYCTVQGMDATRTGNDVVFHEKGSISFGEKDNTRSQAVCEVEDFLKRAHVAYQIPDDIIHQQWNKWMLNFCRFSL